MRQLLLAALMLFSVPAAQAAAGPEIAPERIVLHTVGGDLVLALYPKAAPKTVAQILKLARLGVYDTTHFYRLEKGFVLQIGNAQDRIRPLTPEQTASIHKLPVEFGTHELHHRGTLSMARWENDDNSAETSFSILLGNAPHLDGKYTIFGTVESGWEVLQFLESMPADDQHRPKTRLTVEKAEVLTQAELSKRTLRGPQTALMATVAATVAATEAEKSSQKADLRAGLIFILLSIIAVGLCAAALSSRLKPQQQNALVLVMVLLCGFALLMILTPVGQKDARVALLVFLGLLGTFRLMGQFEASR